MLSMRLCVHMTAFDLDCDCRLTRVVKYHGHTTWWRTQMLRTWNKPLYLKVINILWSLRSPRKVPFWGMSSHPLLQADKVCALHQKAIRHWYNSVYLLGLYIIPNIDTMLSGHWVCISYPTLIQCCVPTGFVYHTQHWYNVVWPLVLYIIPNIDTMLCTPWVCISHLTLIQHCVPTGFVYHTQHWYNVVYPLGLYQQYETPTTHLVLRTDEET